MKIKKIRDGIGDVRITFIAGESCIIISRFSKYQENVCTMGVYDGLYENAAVHGRGEGNLNNINNLWQSVIEYCQDKGMKVLYANISKDDRYETRRKVYRRYGWKETIKDFNDPNYSDNLYDIVFHVPDKPKPSFIEQIEDYTNRVFFGMRY